MSGVTASSAPAPATTEPSNDATDLSAAERGEAGPSTPESSDNQNQRGRDHQNGRGREDNESFSGVSVEC
jgi:hypothetical protein